MKRHDRLVQEWDHDPYHSKRKLPEPTICPSCGVVFRRGRWVWASVRPQQAQESLCPACRRVRDQVPAGFLVLAGEFFAAHRDEILNLIHNVEKREQRTHPLKRIMNIEDLGEGTQLTFTDPNLARGIGEAIHNAYGGELDYRYTKQEHVLRVRWER